MDDYVTVTIIAVRVVIGAGLFRVGLHQRTLDGRGNSSLLVLPSVSPQY